MNSRLKQLRAVLGISQHEFANQTGITYSSVASYETGHRSPSASAISSIIKTFGVSEAWLRRGEGEMFTEDARLLAVRNVIDEVFADESAEFRRRWFEMSCNLTDEQWRVLEQIAVELVKQQPEMSEEARALVEQIERAKEPTA